MATDRASYYKLERALFLKIIKKKKKNEKEIEVVVVVVIELKFLANEE